MKCSNMDQNTSILFKEGMERLDFFSTWPQADIPVRWNKDREVVDINVVLILCKLLYCKNW